MLNLRMQLRFRENALATLKALPNVRDCENVVERVDALMVAHFLRQATYFVGLVRIRTEGDEFHQRIVHAKRRCIQRGRSTRCGTLRKGERISPSLINAYPRCRRRRNSRVCDKRPPSRSTRFAMRMRNYDGNCAMPSSRRKRRVNVVRSCARFKDRYLSHILFICK